MADDQPQPRDGDEDRGHLMSVEQWNAVVAARQAYLEEIGEPDEQTPLHYTDPQQGGQ